MQCSVRSLQLCAWATGQRGSGRTQLQLHPRQPARGGSAPSPAGPRSIRCVATKAAMAQEAAALIQKQLELYNARQVEPFMELFADDVHVSDGITGAVIATSKAVLRPRYVERFKSPVHCELLGRLVLGSVVVDREIITGLPDGGVADCMATYVVEGDKIKRITFVWSPRTDGVKL